MALNNEIVSDFMEMAREIFDEYLLPVGEGVEKYITPPPIDEETGLPTGSETAYDLRMSLDSFSRTNEGDDVVSDELTSLVLQEELPLTPKQGDILQTIEGKRYQINSWEEDAGHITWLFTATLQ